MLTMLCRRTARRVGGGETPRKPEAHGMTCGKVAIKAGIVPRYGLNVERFTTMSKQITGWYADVFKGWQSKLLGSKPTAEALDTIHKLGARPGKQALANAMAMRPEGVTGSEIVIACGAPQLNKMRGFIADNLLKREAVPPRNGHTVYKLTLATKGAARIKGKAEAAAKVLADKVTKGKKAHKAAPGDRTARKQKAKADNSAVVETFKADVTEALNTMADEATSQA